MANIDINKYYLDLAYAAYGGDLYIKKLKAQISCMHITTIDYMQNYNIKFVPDALLNSNYFFSYKNEESGFVACVFKDENTNEVIIAFRGTERIQLGENDGENISYQTWLKDFIADTNIVNGNLSQQFNDAWEFYTKVRDQFNNNVDIDSRPTIKLVGHSLGGALAQLVAARAFQESYNNNQNDNTIPLEIVETYTYNAPGCRNLLTKFGCNDVVNYSFIKNYSVMNDWCGMFGEQVGTSYLIQPIPLEKIQDINDIGMEGLKKLLCTSHEGIFNYTEKTHGKIIEKPEDFKQTEGLSLWYYDKNNIVKDFLSVVEFASKLNKFSAIFVNTITSYLENVVAQVSYDSLKDAIDIIHREYNVPINQLHYEGNLGDYIIGTNNDDTYSDYYKGSPSILSLGGNDIIWGHGGNDSIHGLSGNDILIGDSTEYKVRELEELRGITIDKLIKEPYLIDESKFESK